MADDDQTPPGPFDAATSETRLAALQALASAYSETPTDPWLAYSDLREAVGVRDKGTFNYHLDRLDGLVVKGEWGYRISRLGMEVVAAVASGDFDPEWTWGPVDAGGDCLFCDDPLCLRYEDGVLRVTCGTAAHALPLPASPSLLDSGPDEDRLERLALAVSQWATLTRRGVCWDCRGHVTGGVEFRDRPPAHYHYHGSCRRCGFQQGVPLGLFLIGHPAVVAFYHEAGIDVRSTPFWRLPFCKPGAETELSTDPLRVRVEATRDGESLSLTVNEAGDVVSTQRRSTDGDGSAGG